MKGWDYKLQKPRLEAAFMISAEWCMMIYRCYSLKATYVSGVGLVKA